MVNPRWVSQDGHVSRSITVRRRGDRRFGRLFRWASISQPEGTCTKDLLRLSPALDSGQE
jgi:hypothetical protein